MKRGNMWFFVLAIVFLANACEPQLSPSEAAFLTAAPIRLDRGLVIRLAEVRYPLASAGPPAVALILENHTDYSVEFLSPRYGQRVFLYSDIEERWVEIEDPTIYLAAEEVDILVPYGQRGNSSALVLVSPDIPRDVDEPINLRIVLVGRVYENGVALEEVGNFIDVVVQPPES